MTDRMRLLDSYEMGTMLLPNRMVMAPMTRCRAGEGNVPTDLMATYYAQRAGTGLIVSEATQVTPEGQGYPFTPGIHSDAQAAGWRTITDAVHAAGGRIFLQLWHVGRISHPLYQPGGALPVAPSAIAPSGSVRTLEGAKPYETPRALETSEIAGVVAQYRHGAELAKRAGFDGVEIHGANGYLIDQFLRSGTNIRSDDYGGSAENRARFLFEVTDAVISVWGADRVGVRLSPNGTFNDMSDKNPKETFGVAIHGLAEQKIGYLHYIETMRDDPAVLVSLDEVRGWFPRTLIVNGGYDRERGEAVLADGRADLVAFGVPFIANPDLPERFRRGAPLNTPDAASFYGGGSAGYTDYPTISQ